VVELIVRWFTGDDLTPTERESITRVGCRTSQPGLRSLEHLDPAVGDDVVG